MFTVIVNMNDDLLGGCVEDWVERCRLSYPPEVPSSFRRDFLARGLAVVCRGCGGIYCTCQASGLSRGGVDYYDPSLANGFDLCLRCFIAQVKVLNDRNYGF